jgi:predicted dehydrogenase
METRMRGEPGATSNPVIRWGIIGAGDIADRIMAPAMRQAPRSELVAVARRDRAAAEAFARKHGARRTYDAVESLLEDPEVDAVYVATPVWRHCPDTLAAAEHGKHVLCEKPMALNVREGERMRAAIEKANVRFMTCFYQRFNARHRKIRELLAAGTIGRVTAVRMNFSGRSPDRVGAWRQDPALSGGGSYMDNASHCVDLLRFLFGEIRAVSAFVDTLAASYPVEDTATSILRLANGAHAVVTSYWSTDDPDEDRNSLLEIAGTDGTIIATPLHDKFSRGQLTVDRRAGQQSYHFDESTHVALLEEFAAALAEGRPPSITDAEGIAALRVVEAVYESSRSGRTIRLLDSATA